MNERCESADFKALLKAWVAAVKNHEKGDAADPNIPTTREELAKAFGYKTYNSFMNRVKQLRKNMEEKGLELPILPHAPRGTSGPRGGEIDVDEFQEILEG